MAMLSPWITDRRDDALKGLHTALAPWPFAQSVLARIALSTSAAGIADLYAGLAEAIELAHSFGIPTKDQSPSRSFSWDGLTVQTKTETAVLLHEIAHWQLAPPHRRGLPDFGLGAGPETGRKSEADAARCVDDETQELEESLASLLGILWEVEMGGPALVAFCEQNWLELYDRPGTAQFFADTLEALQGRGLIDEEGRPVHPRTKRVAA